MKIKVKYIKMCMLLNRSRIFEVVKNLMLPFDGYYSIFIISSPFRCVFVCHHYSYYYQIIEIVYLFN